ncbi:MAG TPA: hypothetical protein VKW78_22780 [Terriglobales bacterium]|nr:hypothetical protein [Terriglobales bacterium]
MPLMRIRLLQNSMECGDKRHAQLTEKRQNVASRSAAEDPVFMLQADQIYLVDVEKVRRPLIRSEIILKQFEADTWRIFVAGEDVVHRKHKAVTLTKLGSQRLTKIGGERSNPTLSRQVVADDGNPAQTCLAVPPLKQNKRVSFVKHGAFP